MTPEKIKAVYETARAEKWTYPQLFDGLKVIGVERYEVNVATHEITYFGGKTSHKQPAPDGFSPLTVGEKFDQAALKTALKRTQSGQSTYEEFLAEIAAAGVPFYRVDMKPRTVSYHAANRKDKLVEKVPQPN
jgi:uncharacterized protein YbcV (DUF1398 family)